MRNMLSMAFIGSNVSKEEISKKLEDLGFDADAREKVGEDIWMDVQDAKN